MNDTLPTEREVYNGIFDLYKERARSVPIDENMRMLVETLNRLPGIATVACCGGHENPGPAQHPAGKWFVTIEVYRYDERGWDALDIVIDAIRQSKGSVAIDLTAKAAGLFLTGKDIHPDAFARLVFTERAQRRKWKKAQL